MIPIQKLPGLKYNVNGKVVTAYGNKIECGEEYLSPEEERALTDFVKATETLKLQSTIRSI